MKFKTIDIGQARDSGMALTLIFLLIILFFDKYILLLPTIIVLVATMTFPAVFKPFAFLWFNLSDMIGAVVSRVILAVIFYGVVLPTGIILRLSGKDQMSKRKWKNGSNSSVMIERNHTYTPKDLQNPF